MHEHAHEHEHEHEHEHVHERRESALAPSGQGTVVLDIGADVGALIVHTNAALAGVEIELARRGEAKAFVHTEVRERRLPDGSVYAGVFPAVAIGDYTLVGIDGRPSCDVTIEDGRVTEVHW
jgi:hypothetical protein